MYDVFVVMTGNDIYIYDYVPGPGFCYLVRPMIYVCMYWLVTTWVVYFTGGPLHLGDIETLPDMSVCVRCPWHSWRFELKTGQVRQPKGRQLSATIYPVQVKQDGTLLVGFSELNSKYFTDEDF